MNKILNITAVLAAALSVSACKTTVQKPVKVDYQMEYTVGDVTFDMVKIRHQLQAGLTGSVDGGYGQ